MIVKEVTVYDWLNWLNASDSYSNNFSREGAIALFEWLEVVAEDSEQNMMFDPIAWCVEFTEFEDLKALMAEYDNIKSMDDLTNATTVVCTDPLIVTEF